MILLRKVFMAPPPNFQMNSVTIMDDGTGFPFPRWEKIEKDHKSHKTNLLHRRRSSKEKKMILQKKFQFCIQAFFGEPSHLEAY